MAYDNSFTAVTGATYTAAQYNTYVKGNFTAIWVYTTAGDLAYATSASALTRLGIGAAGSVLYSTGSAPAWKAPGAAYKYLRMASGGASLEWAAAGMTVDYFYDETGHTYGTATWRDMPNSSKSITVTTTSTIVCIGHVAQAATDTPNYYGFFDSYFSIDGNNITGMTTKTSYCAGYEPRTVFGIKTGIAAGTKTIKLREYCGAGSYGVTQIMYVVFVIPE